MERSEIFHAYPRSGKFQLLLLQRRPRIQSRNLGTDDLFTVRVLFEDRTFYRYGWIGKIFPPSYSKSKSEPAWDGGEAKRIGVRWRFIAE